MKARELAALLLQYPESEVVERNASGVIIPLKKAEIITLAEGRMKGEDGKRRSPYGYTTAEYVRCKRERYDMKLVRKLKVPKVCLVFPSTPK